MFLLASLFHTPSPFYKYIMVTMWLTKSESQNAIEPLSLLFWYELKVLICANHRNASIIYRIEREDYSQLGKHSLKFSC